MAEPAYLMEVIFVLFRQQAPALEHFMDMTGSFYKSCLPVEAFNLSVFHLSGQLIGRWNANRLPFSVFDQMVERVCSSVSGV